MSVSETINTALSAVLENCWAVELPPEPEFPALVFQIESTPESGWVLGGGYTQHVVAVLLLTYNRLDLDAYPKQIQQALEALEGYIAEEESGDAEFEDAPGVYGYYQNFRIRTTT